MLNATKLKLGLIVVLIGVLCFGLFAAPKKLSGAPYKIGAIFAVTGDASSLGIPERNTALMLEKKINQAGGINGRPIKVIIEDNKSEPSEAVNAAMRLIERDKVLAIIGPSRTGDSLAVANVAEKAKVPLVTCAAGIDIVEPVKKWVFKTPQSDRLAVQQIMKYLQKKKINRVAILSDSSGFGKGGLKEIRELMPKARFQLVAIEEYGPKDTSMMTQLTKIKSSRPQALICWGTPPGPAIIAKEMRMVAMNIPLVCSHGVANETFLKIAGKSANGVVLPVGRLLVADQIPATHPQKKLLDEYAKQYKAQFGKNADTFGGHAWDAMYIVTNAIRKSGANREKIRTSIEQTKGFVGTAGTFNFSAKDHNGLTQDSFVMVTVNNGKWRLVK